MKITWDISEWLEFRDRLADSEGFEKHMKLAAQDIAKRLHDMLIKHTPVDFGTLQAFWQTPENYAYTVEQTATGFEVTLYNRAKYATWVNDGHRQQPGRFIPGYWEGDHFRYDPNADGGMVLKQPWVQGRFFVEKGIVDTEDAVEKLIEKQLQKWWKWCIRG